MDPKEYVSFLRAGAVVACPTETQMGLLADALDRRAVGRVREMKRRADDEPIGVLVPSLESAVSILRDVSVLGIQLAQEHWPGPLTLVMQGQMHLPPALLKDGKVAIRMPGPSPALDLVQAFGGPLTATSANPSGEPALTTEEELKAAFGDKLAAVVPGAPGGSEPSTVVDVTGDRPVVLRQGAFVLDV